MTRPGPSRGVVVSQSDGIVNEPLALTRKAHASSAVS